MCRVPAGALPAGTYTPPTWLDALAGGNAGAVLPSGAPNASTLASPAAAGAAAGAPQQLQLHVPLPAISDAELSMLDSLLNVKVEGASTTAAAAAQQTQQQQQARALHQQPIATKPPAVSTAPPAAFVPPPPAFLANVFSSGAAPSSGALPYGAVTHANASAYAAHASQMLDNRGKRVKKVRLFFSSREQDFSPEKTWFFFSLARSTECVRVTAPRRRFRACLVAPGDDARRFLLEVQGSGAGKRPQGRSAGAASICLLKPAVYKSS